MAWTDHSKVPCLQSAARAADSSAVPVVLTRPKSRRGGSFVMRNNESIAGDLHSTPQNATELGAEVSTQRLLCRGELPVLVQLMRELRSANRVGGADLTWWPLSHGRPLLPQLCRLPAQQHRLHCWPQKELTWRGLPAV